MMTQKVLELPQHFHRLHFHHQLPLLAGPLEVVIQFLVANQGVQWFTEPDVDIDIDIDDIDSDVDIDGII